MRQQPTWTDHLQCKVEDLLSTYQLAQSVTPVVEEIRVFGLDLNGSAEVFDSGCIAAQAVVQDASVVERIAAAGVSFQGGCVVLQRPVILANLGANMPCQRRPSNSGVSVL